MNIEKTIVKLNNLSDSELNVLKELVLKEMENRSTYMSNVDNTPSEQCESLQSFFSNAWIHG